MLSGTMYELGAALQGLCATGIVNRLGNDRSSWEPLNALRAQWNRDAFAKTIRNGFAHHLGEIDAYRTGIAHADEPARFLVARDAGSGADPPQRGRQVALRLVRWAAGKTETPLVNGTRCAIVALWALDDFTHESGPTDFLSGSHLSTPRKTLEELKSPEFAASPAGRTFGRALMPAGSVVVFITSHTYHRAGRATRPGRRLGLRVAYRGVVKNAPTAAPIA